MAGLESLRLRCTATAAAVCGASLARRVVTALAAATPDGKTRQQEGRVTSRLPFLAAITAATACLALRRSSRATAVARVASAVGAALALSRTARAALAVRATLTSRLVGARCAAATVRSTGAGLSRRRCSALLAARTRHDAQVEEETVAGVGSQAEVRASEAEAGCLPLLCLNRQDECTRTRNECTSRLPFADATHAPHISCVACLLVCSHDERSLAACLRVWLRVDRGMQWSSAGHP